MRDIRIVNMAAGQQIESDEIIKKIGIMDYRNAGNMAKVSLFDEGKAVITSGLRVTATTGMTISVASGTCMQKEIDVTGCIQPTAQVITLDAATGFSRTDIIEGQIASITDKTDHARVGTVASGGGGVVISNEEIKRDLKYYLKVQKKTGSTTVTAATAGTLTGLVAIAGTIDLSELYTLHISDGEDASWIEIDCRGAVPTATTKTEIINAINAAVGRTMASAGAGNVIVLTGNGTGEASVFTIKPPITSADSDALEQIFGISIGGLYKYEYKGVNSFFKLAEIDVGAATTTITTGMIRNVDQKSTWASGASDVLLHDILMKSTMVTGFNAEKVGGETIADIIARSTAIDEKLHTGTTAADYGLAFRRQKTLNTKFGLWADVVWGSASTIIIKPKAINGFRFIGCVLNNGKYLEDVSGSDITVTLDTNTLDALGQIQNNAWYVLYGYEISATGLLGFNLGLAPAGTCHTGSSTTSIIPHQINSKDINKLFPVGAGFVVWHDSTHFETPFYKLGTGYTPSGNVAYVGSYSGANIVPAGTMGITPVDTDPFYQVDNFQPLDYTGAIATVIGTKGWLDTGLRFYSNASSQIQQFQQYDSKIIFANGTGAADTDWNTGVGVVAITSGTVGVFRFPLVPPDKSAWTAITYDGTTSTCREYDYYATYKEIKFYGGVSAYASGLFSKIKHGLGKFSGSSTFYISIIGYEI